MRTEEALTVVLIRLPSRVPTLPRQQRMLDPDRHMSRKEVPGRHPKVRPALPGWRPYGSFQAHVGGRINITAVGSTAHPQELVEEEKQRTGPKGDQVTGHPWS